MGFFANLLAKLTGTWQPEERTSPHAAGRSASWESGGVATLEAPRASRSPEASAGFQWWAADGAIFTAPAEIPPPELSTGARALENLLISHFDGHDLTLPPLLNGAERVLIKLRDPKCNLTEVAAIVAEDPVIAAAVLRMANSALYRGLQKITALPAALNRLGINALRTLMLRESLRSAMFDRRTSGNDFAGVIWRRSLACATVMHGLSEFTNIPRDDAFLYGLLHDIGNIVVLRIVQEQASVGGDELTFEEFEYLCSECHQEFGELIAEAWKLPADLKSLITSHHEYPTDDDPKQVERLQLLLADGITSLLGYAPVEPFNLLEWRVTKALELPQRANFISFLERLPEQVEDVVGSA